MATVLCAGPSQWFLGRNTAYSYIGMCESDTMLDLSPVYQGIGLDGACGGEFDRQLWNVTATVSGDLSYWNEPVVDTIKSFLGSTDDGTPGAWADGSFGTLLRTEEKQFSLCIVSMFANKTAFSGAGMHAAWTFPFVFPLPLRRNLSSRATRERIAFEAITVMNGLGGGTLYTNSAPEGLPNVD